VHKLHPFLIFNCPLGVAAPQLQDVGGTCRFLHTKRSSGAYHVRNSTWSTFIYCQSGRSENTPFPIFSYNSTFKIQNSTFLLPLPPFNIQNSKFNILLPLPSFNIQNSTFLLPLPVERRTSNVEPVIILLRRNYFFVNFGYIIFVPL
jgi:hypothetical protein